MTDKKTSRAMHSALGQAGLSRQEFKSRSVQLRELTGVCMVRLRSLQKLGELQSAGLGLGESTGQCCGSDPTALCLRPTEWLLFSETADPVELVQRVQRNTDAKLTAAYNQSDGLAVLRLSGNGAPWLLSKVSGLDYLAGTDAGQHCAQTRMGQLAVLVHYHDPVGRGFVFDLVIDRSCAQYLWLLLCESAPHADDLHQAFGAAA